MHQKINSDASKDDADGMPFDALACVDEMHAHAPHAARYDSYTHHHTHTLATLVKGDALVMQCVTHTHTWCKVSLSHTECNLSNTRTYCWAWNTTHKETDKQRMYHRDTLDIWRDTLVTRSCNIQS